MNSYSDDEFQDFDDNSDFEYGSDSGLADGLNDDFITQNIVRKPKKFETDFKPLDEKDLIQLQESEITSIFEIFPLERELLKLLLRAYRWNKDKLTDLLSDDPENAYKMAGIHHYIENDKPVSIIKKTRVDCIICYREEEEIKFLELPCGDDICLDCHIRFIEDKVRDGSVRKLICPGNCGLNYKESILETILDNSLFLKVKDLQNNLFADDKSNIKWCPSPDCKFPVQCEVSISSLTTNIPSVKCKAGHPFCFGCSSEDHQPILCSYVKRWLKKCEDDSETSNWIHANTKECPKCNSTIEKNGGCNHMTCRKCNNEFCWVCMGPWVKHGQAWYNCNRYQDQDSTEARDKQAKSRKMLERYLHYYNRYANHLQSSKLDQQLYARTEEKMNLLQKSSEYSWIEVQFLKDAVDVLVKSRHTLRWTYPFAYYLESNNTTKLFEDIQQDLELNTEALSGLLETPIEESTIVEMKQKVMDKATYVSQRRDILLEDVIKGHEEERWTYQDFDLD